MKYQGKRWLFFLTINLFFCFSSIHTKQEVFAPVINGAPTITNEAPTMRTNEKVILQLYQLMKDVHEILLLKGIRYWVTVGTLLGAARHKGIIPWDDDLDICIDKNQNNDFISLKPIFEQLGYYVLSWTDRIGHRIVFKNEENKILAYPHMDILVYEQQGNTICYRWKMAKDKFKSEFIDAIDLFPIKDYQFGSFWVKGPNKSLKHLKSVYGDDCMDVAYYGIDHGKVEKRKMRLGKKDKVPAMPIGPLQDRVIQKNLAQ